MNWQDTGFLLSKNKYSENNSIAEFYTKNHGKVTGVIYGSTSKKIKNYLLIGNKFHLNFNSKNDSKVGYFKLEIDQVVTPLFMDDKNKLLCISYAMSLIKLLTVEDQQNENIFFYLYVIPPVMCFCLKISFIKFLTETFYPTKTPFFPTFLTKFEQQLRTKTYS